MTMETGLEEFEDVTVKTRNVEWEGDIYIELYPFTKRTYDLFLVGDSDKPGYLGNFNYVKEKYFNYLKAKGKGQDVKSPITIHNINSKYQNDFLETYQDLDFASVYGKNGKDCGIRILSYHDIHIKSNEIESDYSSANEDIQKEIHECIKKGMNSGSFDYNEKIIYDKEDLRKFNLKLGESFSEKYNVYVEASPKINKLFLEIKDKTNDNLISFSHEYNPLQFSLNNKHHLLETISCHVRAYIQDKDFDEFQKEDTYIKENGTYYKECFNDITNSKNSESKIISLLSHLPVELHYDIYFNKSDINQTTYYKYCDTNKISFKDFKEIRTDIPLGLLNKSTIEEIRKTALSNINKTMSFKNLIGRYSFKLYANNFYKNRSASYIGAKAFNEIFDKLVESGEREIKTSIDMSQNTKHYFDEDIAIFNCKDYGDTIEGSFIFRNTEFEFDYDAETSDITLHKFDYDIEDNETGYYKEEELPVLLENPAIQELLFDQIDFEVNNFIAEQRYGSLDDMLLAAEEKAGGSKSIKSKDDLEL